MHLKVRSAVSEQEEPSRSFLTAWQLQMEERGPAGTSALNTLAWEEVIDSSPFILVAARNHNSMGNGI